ncbi:hypothetical protein COO91_03382 [Nostoc flagelliforme CCNUN1]|uniref:Uncharacterized protein n=1 Tax=Nostoc flagelliforme CCNUN1 TaxID=2038116 RepID=A0A2K8SPS3_9NOSO|nr:hypothetical protein [Nostoc flagelliforme]AUB37437.1 hypothetical protein COO91_03382 [Nostoc flagelliforme CCNUN1]
MPDENELRIKFKTDEEWDLLTLIRVKAHSEGLSVEQYVINELKKCIELSAPPPPQNPTFSPTQMDEVRRRINNVDMSLRSEVRKVKKDISFLAEAIAAIQAH